MPSPWIWRAIWAIGFVLIAATLAFAALPYIASTRIVRDRIAWEMSAWSGFRVAIDGTPQIEVWPKFRAILTDVTLSSWTDPDAPPVVQAERVEIDLSALAALRGDVVFQATHLIRPTLRAQRIANGLFSPPIPTGGRLARSIDAARGILKADPAKPDLGKLPSDPFGMVEVRDGRVIGAVNGKDAEILTGLNGQANWSALNAGATLSATGIWRGESVSVDLTSASPLLLFAGGTSTVTAALKSAPANFSFEGNASLAQNAFFDGQAKFAAPSLRRVLEWLGANPVSGGTIGAVSVTSKVTGETGRVKFSGTELTLNKNPGMGALDLSFADSLPVISGTLAFDTLDLRAFLSAFTPVGSSSGQMPDQIDTSFADRFNLDLRLSAAHATAGSIQLTDVAATAQVKNGLAVFDISDAAAFGGNIQSSLRFDRKPDGTQVEMRLLASDINGAQFGQAAGMKRLVPTGTGSVSIILKGPGKAWNSAMDNADGSISANFGQGTLTGLNLPAFLKRCQDGGFFPLDDVADGALPIDGAELKASISNGVARIDKAEARSAKTRIWVSGIVPYAGGGLALSGAVTATDAKATANAPQPGEAQQDAGNQASFFVGGTWTTPFISPINRARALQ
jgi:AsmA protein